MNVGTKPFWLIAVLISFCTLQAQAQSLGVKVVSTTGVDCPTDSKGVAELQLSGQSGSVEVYLMPAVEGASIRQSGTSIKISKLPAASYVISVRDAKGQVGGTQVTVASEMAPYTFQISQPSCPSCEDGRIDIAANEFSIRWKNPSLSGASLTGLSAGSYSVELSSKGCTVVETITLK